jgi:hypothetical protein
MSKQIVHQRRFATADIDNGCSTRRGGPRDEFKGSFQMRTVPADRVWRLLSVDLLPMSLYVHVSPSFTPAPGIDLQSDRRNVRAQRILAADPGVPGTVCPH